MFGSPLGVYGKAPGRSFNGILKGGIDKQGEGIQRVVKVGSEGSAHLQSISLDNASRSDASALEGVVKGGCLQAVQVFDCVSSRVEEF
jgi:hypothetical protein